MKILKFKALNYKGIKELEIIPDGNLVIISGKNGAGKSSTIDGIKNILSGKDKLTIKPIRNGESKAELELEVEGKNKNGELIKYIIKKTFTENGESLQVLNDDGLKYPSPQTFLNKLTGGNGFDPNAFLNKNEKEQREDLIKFSGINLQEEDEKLQVLYNKRHQIGIDGKALAQYTEDEINEAKKYSNKEEIDIIGLTQHFEEESKNHYIYNTAQNDIVHINSRIEELKNTLQKLHEELLKLSDIKKPESNLDSIKCELQDADDENKKIRKATQIIENHIKVTSKKEEWTLIDSQYKEVQTERQQLLESMKMPLEGLKVTEENIFYNDIPVKQLSTSEGLKIAISMYIETCIRDNTDLKLIIVKNGSDLDLNSIKTIADITTNYDDLLVFIERVVNSQEEAVGIYIDNGEIVK